MTETRSYPRRDADGRLATIADLVGVVAAGLVIGVALLLVFDAVTATAGLARFGSGSGWLAVILPAWVFVEDFRAAPYGAARVLVALLAAGIGAVAGLVAAGVASTVVPALASGIVGAAVLSLGYAVVWFYGLRLAGRGAH